MKKNKISKNWINKQRRDIYVRKSKLEGYRSRAIYKLKEIDDKFKIIRNGIKVVDLGSAPGSWSQYLSEKSKNSKILSKVKWLFGKFAIIKSQNFKHAVSSKINMQKARKIAFAPHVNIGVFSLEKSSSVWNVWQNNLKETLKHGRIFGSEGLAINLSVYVDNVDTEFLPLGCNWIASHILPKFDQSKKEFVEPYLPNNKIGIMHLAAGIWKEGKDMRLDKSIKVEIKSLKNDTLSKSLRFEKN